MFLHNRLRGGLQTMGNHEEKLKYKKFAEFFKNCRKVRDF
jgi:hypothetical protein